MPLIFRGHHTISLWKGGFLSFPSHTNSRMIAPSATYPLHTCCLAMYSPDIPRFAGCPAVWAP